MQLFKYQSKSEKDTIYTVRKLGVRIWCDPRCWGFKRHQKCWHTADVRDNNGALAIGSRRKPIATASAGFIKPMFAATMSEKFNIDSGDWVVEEKYNGHRLIIQINGGQVTAWSRKGIERELDKETLRELSMFPDCTLDSEQYVPNGGRSFDVKRKDKKKGKTVLAVFDILRLLDHSTCSEKYTARRRYLREMFKKLGGNRVVLAKMWKVESLKEAKAICAEIWKRDGEGIILKRKDGIYRPGDRKGEFVKMKQLLSDVLKITGFKTGKLGKCSIILLKHKDGNETKVKVRNMALLGRLQRTPNKYVGQEVRIEFQERTPDGGFFHPRWDRFEKE